MKQKLDTRIAIIGAGTAGLTAALALKDRGYKNVVVLEKNDRVGGKTYSYLHKGVHYDMGSMMFSGSSEMAKLADRFQVPYKPFETKGFYYSHGKYISPLAFAQQQFSLAEIVRSFYQLRKIVRETQLSEPGFYHPHPDLYVDFTSFLKQNNLEAAGALFQPAISGLGYGYPETTPALYHLKILSSMLDTSLLRSILTNGNQVCYFPGGWMELWEKVAATLDVRLSSTITSIERTTKKGIQITVNNKTQTFDRLIITAPLQYTKDYLDVTEEELKLFNKIRSNRMVTTLIKGSVPLKTLYFADNTSSDRLGHVIGTECYTPETQCSVLFQIVPKKMSKAAIKELFVADLKEAGCEVEKVILQCEWDYFYHVASKELKAGFYEKINALQGTKNTFYAASLLNFETVGHCQQFSTFLIETYF